ncbi:MAG TPA: type II toxin-antitoxin system prevent-host-death family antitoxin [Clostridiales bacterium]|nr:type II toxin-antitoxin system prevent-host-death family antitoxin [Clostridiales bacterium]
MTIINATTARNNFFKLMEEAIANNEPIIVTGKSGNVVVLSEADFRAMEETLYLCSIPTMREKIMKGLDTPLDECLEDEDE